MPGGAAGACAQDAEAGLALASLPPPPRPPLPRDRAFCVLAGVQIFLTGCLSCLPPRKDPTAFPVPTFQDLAGFWDLLQLSIEDVTLKFLELQQLKANSWKLLEPECSSCV